VYDVVVVGARAAGAATALLLARAGLRVLLVDRGQYGSDTMSTHALMRGGVLQLTRWGLLDAVIASGTPPVRLTTFRYAKDVVTVEILPSFGVDALYAPRRTVLDRLLVDAATAAGVDTMFRSAVTDLCRDRHRNVNGVIGRSRDGASFEVRARVVVGADGIRSSIAGLVDARPTRVGEATNTAVTYGYWSELETNGYEWAFRPRAASGFIPTNDGKTCVFASAPRELIGRGGLGPLTQAVADSSPELAARLAHGIPPAHFRTFRAQPGFVRHCWGRGWALVGDAAYFKDPITAHGLTDALRDAELLARAILEVFAGADEGDALGCYETTRNALSADLFDVTEIIAGYRWMDEEIGDLLIRLSRAMSAEVRALAGLPGLPVSSQVTPGPSDPRFPSKKTVRV
jgi:2-polyprenyl-6-methoxyphenol hydroxylase-like FAD-dependent oxidoreductase